MKSISIILLAIVLSSAARITPLPTNVKITIVDELGNSVEGATVTLYNNKEDYRAEENPVQTGLTDKKGIVTFKKLDAKVYFVHAYKGDKNNNFAGVQTDTLKEGKVNKIIIVIN
jgi:uncharacterized GH25 family protein